MTTYSSLIADIPQPEPNQSGFLPLSISTNTTLSLIPHGRLQSILEVTATATGLTLAMPSGAFQEQGADTLLTNTGANSFTLQSTVVAAGASYWGYIDSSNAYQFYRLGPLTPGEVNALVGFALSSTGTQLQLSVAPLAGLGLVGTGQAPINVNPDNSTVDIAADVVRVRPLGITAAQIANSTIGLGKFTSPLIDLNVVQASSPSLASGASLVLATPGRTIANQFNVLAQVVEFVGAERRVAKETDYRVDLAFETQVTITKLSAGSIQVLAAVAYEVG